MVTIRLIESNIQAIHTSQSVLTPLNPQFQADLFLVLAFHVLRDCDMPSTVILQWALLLPAVQMLLLQGAANQKNFKMTNFSRWMNWRAYPRTRFNINKDSFHISFKLSNSVLL